MGSNSTYPAIVQTPNGAGLLMARTWLEQSGIAGREPDGALVRHDKKQEIDLDKCAKVMSKTGRDGWLVVYRIEEIK